MYLSRLEKEIELLRTLSIPQFRRMPLKRLLGIRNLLKDEKFTRLNGKVVINSFLPPFPGPAFTRLARGIEQIGMKKAVPVSAYIALTDRCTYNCWHCSRTFRSGTEMSAACLRKLVLEVQELGVCIIGFTGGEPLLRDGAADIIGAVDERSSTILFTTGKGFTPETAAELKKNRLFGVAVSLDHYDSSIHDERRGSKGAYKTAVDAISESVNQGFYTMLQLVATKEMANAPVFDRYLELAAGLGVHEIRLLEPMPAGNLLRCPSKCVLDAGEREELRKLHVRTNSSRKLTKVCSFAQIEDSRLYGCGAGFQHLYVDAYGNVCPCDFTPVAFGNVASESVRDIWARMNGAFNRPRCTCFLMDNAKKLSEKFANALPIPYSAASNECSFDGGDEIPRYYKVLGWK